MFRNSLLCYDQRVERKNKTHRSTEALHQLAERPVDFDFSKALKIDLHLHTNADPQDRLKHTAEELIERAAEYHFDVLCLTNHNVVTYNKQLARFAERRGILLIPGIEKAIEKRHVLLVNVDEAAMRLRTFDDLRRYKKDDMLVIAPHPYFPSIHCLWGKLKKHIDVFDAIEYSYFYHEKLNCNRKAVELAQRAHLPLVGTSDCHELYRFGTNYSLVDCEKTPSALVAAIKKGRVELVTQPLGLFSIVFAAGGLARF